MIYTKRFSRYRSRFVRDISQSDEITIFLCFVTVMRNRVSRT